MAQPQQSINLVAPAFKGVNTEDSPIAQDPSFADIADNAIIDKRGRIAARKGFSMLTTTNPIGTDFLHSVHYFFDTTTEEVFSAGDNKIFSGTSTLTDITPTSYTITDNDWKIVNFNDKAYFFQRNYEPLVYETGVGLKTFSDAAINNYATSTFMKCNEALSAYGRLWIADSPTENHTIHWSDLLIGNRFGPDATTAGVYAGSAGSIDVSKAWPDGDDEIVALSAHNNTLIVFGKHSILVYANAVSPSSMYLADTIAGVGCIDRNSVQHIGTDVLFMSYSGLRSLGRVIQEKSLPLSDLSGTIKTELIQIIESNTSPVSSVYSPENSFYLITFRDSNVTFCFDLKGALETGAYRVTRWPSSSFKSFERKKDGTLYIGTFEGLAKYTGYSDNNSSYRFRYYSPSLTFGDASKLKFVKSLTPTIVGAENATVFLKWAYDFGTTYSTATVTVGSEGASIGFFGESEYIEISALDSYGISSTLTGDVYVVNKFLGDFASAPTTGSGGGAILNGDSYQNTTDGVFYVYVSGAWEDITTLTVTDSVNFSGGTTTSKKKVNATGNGSTVTIGAEADINGEALSIQEINVLALIGRTV